MNSTKRILLIVFAALAVLSFSLFVSCKNKNKDSESSASAGYSSESSTESNTDNTESKGNSEPTSGTKTEESKDEPTSEACRHNYVTKFDSANHWQECAKCGDLTEKTPHNLVANGANKKCDGCDITADYTEAENFAYWIAGIKHASTATDNYTTTKIEMNGETGQTIDLYKTVEARNGNKYYRVEYSGEKNLATGEESALEFDRMEIVKTVSDGEKIRTKYFYKNIDSDGSEDKSGAYVSPRYAEENNGESPARSLSNYDLLLKATSVEELRTLFESDYKEDGGTSQSSKENDIITVSITRNADGSVTIELKIQYESQEVDWDEVEYTEIGVESIRYVVKDGKLVSFVDDLKFANKYADESKNSSEIEFMTIDFVYDEFDEEFYNSVDVTTDNTTNEYTATVYVKVPNADSYFLFTEAYVDETLSVEAIYEDIESDLDFLVDMRGIRVFELYADKDYTVLLTDFTVEDKEYNFYLKFTPPEGKALVVTLFKEKRKNYDTGEEYEIIVRHTAYLKDIGTRFFATSVHDGHKVLEIDGVENPEYLSFVCDENRVYYILYEGKYAESEIPCKALHEWEYDEYWHWHRCGQHEYEDPGKSNRFDETRHDYNEEGVCETCGYRGRE